MVRESLMEGPSQEFSPTTLTIVVGIAGFGSVFVTFSLLEAQTLPVKVFFLTALTYSLIEWTLKIVRLTHSLLSRRRRKSRLREIDR